MEKIAICPGSFDPITKGHENIIERASKLFDKVYVCVGINPNKTTHLFTPEERVELIEKVIQKYDNVKALNYDCLTVEIADKLGACAIVKGLRNSIDFEDETNQANYNSELNENIETIFLLADEKLSRISSTFIKEIANKNIDIEKYIPEEIYEDVKERLLKK